MENKVLYNTEGGRELLHGSTLRKTYYKRENRSNCGTLLCYTL
jgi:hypothetical protein